MHLMSRRPESTMMPPTRDDARQSAKRVYLRTCYLRRYLRHDAEPRRHCFRDAPQPRRFIRIRWR